VIRRASQLFFWVAMALVVAATLPPSRLAAQSDAPAEMVSPQPGSTLTSSTVTFTWTSGNGVSQYWLWIGSQPGGADIYTQSQGTNLSTTVSGLPTTTAIYVRLWSQIGGNWQYNDYPYGPGVATSTPASMAASATPLPTTTSSPVPTSPSVVTATSTPNPTRTSTSPATLTLTPTPTPSPTLTQTVSPSRTPAGIPTGTQLPSFTPTLVPTPTPSVTPTRTSTPTATAAPSGTPTPTQTPTPTPTPLPRGGSLSLNGTTAYAEAPDAAELHVSDWTVEVWFKDEHSSYSHPRARIVTKGDIASPEVPFFASVDTGLLYVGMRSAGTAETLTYDLTAGGVSPNTWHHLAATFQASSRTLTIYVDATQRAQTTLASASAGNTLPLIIGRSGTGGNYWLGKLDDLRVWNVARTAAEINANYQAELALAPTGLVGNWRFDEGGGTTANDSAGAAQNAALQGGAAYSADNPVAGGGTGGTPAPTGSPTPTSSFTLSMSPSSQTIGLAGNVAYDAQVVFDTGFTSDNTDLAVSALPSGVTGRFEPNPLPHQGRSVLTLTADGSPLPGTYALTVSATANGITRAQQVSLVVTDQPDFTIGVSPNAQDVSLGSTVSYSIQIDPMNSFSDPVAMSVSGLPAAASASFAPNPLPPGTTGTLYVTTSSNSPTGDYILTITGSARGTSHTASVELFVRAGAVWAISSVGSTGVANNTARVGQGRNDGLNRLYVGTVDTGRVIEFSWNGSAWSAPLDIGGSPNGVEIHNMGIGPARNDGLNRVYACSLDGNLYELSFGGGSWSQRIVGVPLTSGEYCTHAVVGDARGDGRNRLYATRGPNLVEYTWNGTSWDSLYIGHVSLGILHGVALGRGRGGTGNNNLYVASTATGTYEARFSGGAWSFSSMGDSNDIRNVSLGAGRNDGVTRVYAATTSGVIREFTWNGAAWTFTTIINPIGNIMVHAYVLAGRNDGVQRVYSSAGDGNLYELTYTGSGWAVETLGGGQGYMYGMHVGAGRNDGRLRLYGASFNHRVYEYTRPG
jgi:hypothetical protein